MPSLPVDNQALSSKEDAYRRYFGSLKNSSPPKPRSLLCRALLNIVIISSIVSIPNFVMLYFEYKESAKYYEPKHLYYLHNFTEMIVTWFWCFVVIYVIFTYEYSNVRIMILNASIISLLSFGFSCFLSFQIHQNGMTTIIHDSNIWETENYRWDKIYFLILRFPVTLYLSILMMYLSQYCCNQLMTFMVTSRMDSVQQNKMLKEKLITVPNDGTTKESVEVYEYVSQKTGTIYADDEDMDLSLSIDQNDNADRGYGSIKNRSVSMHTVTFQELQQAARSVVTKNMTLYCLVFGISLLCWFLILTVDPKNYDEIRVILYALLLLIYYGFKWCLKRCARKIDTAILYQNFSFEIITEILMSAFYWCNFRMFTIRYKFHKDDTAWSFPLIGCIHICAEIFQDSIRMSSPYFNFVGKYISRSKKSNILQWKVRGAIDTSIRFIIAMWSIVFVSVRYMTESYPRNIGTNIDLRASIILNYSVFLIELMYFGCLILRPRCAGKISDEKQINMAEPLMRIYNADKRLFLGAFCGTMVMASLLVI